MVLYLLSVVYLYFDSKRLTKSSNFIFKLCVLYKNQDVSYGCEQVYTFTPELLNLQSNIYRPGGFSWG